MAGMVRQLRVAVTAAGGEVVDGQPVLAPCINHLAANPGFLQHAALDLHLHAHGLRKGTRAGCHLGHRLQVFQQLGTCQAHQRNLVAEGLHLEHIAVGELAVGQGVAHAAGVHDGQVGAGALLHRARNHHAQIGGLRPHAVAVAIEHADSLTHRQGQARSAVVLERFEEVAHRRVFGDALGVDLARAVGLALRQVDRQQLVLQQLNLAGIDDEIGTSDVLAPLVRLHDPGAVLSIRRAGLARHIGVNALVLGAHADRVLAVATDDQVQAFPGRQSARHLDIAGRVDAALAVGVVPHVGGSDHHVGTASAAQFGQQFGGLLGGFAELDVDDVGRHHHLVRVLRRQAHHRNAVAAALEHAVRLVQTLARGLVVDVGCQQREAGPLTLLLQHRQRFVELVVADRRGVVAEQVHALEVGLGILQVALGHAGVDVTAVEQQHMATGRGHLGADAVDQGLARGQPVLAVAVRPEAAVVVVGVQHRQFQGRTRRRGQRTAGQQGHGGGRNPASNRDHGAGSFGNQIMPRRQPARPKNSPRERSPLALPQGFERG